MNRFALASIALLLCCVATSLGDEVTAPGLDLVVLVDCSGSISTATRQSYRDLLVMMLNALARGTDSTRLTHRLAVVSFGSSPRVDIALTAVDAHSAPVLQAGLTKFQTVSRGNTDFVAPFRAAAAEFHSLPRNAGRRRAIVLLTDGVAFVPGEQEQAMTAVLRQLFATSLEGVTLDVVLIGNRTKEPLWQRLAPNRVLVSKTDRGELLATLHRVVTNATGTRATQMEVARAPQFLVVPPYLDLIVFDVFRGTSGRSVSIVPPGSGEPLTARNEGVEEVSISPTLSTIVVRRPAAGVWTFRKTDPAARVRVLSQQFFPRGMLIDPPSEPPLQQHDDVRIRYRLMDGGGGTLQEMPSFPLAVGVSLVTPNESRVVLPMRRDAPALYRSVAAARCSLPGRYWTEVHVTTRDSHGDEVRVFEDRWSGFGVEATSDRRLEWHAANASALQSTIGRHSATDQSPIKTTRDTRPRLHTLARWCVLIVGSIPLLFLFVRWRR